MQLTSRPTTVDGLARVHELRDRLQAYLPHLLFESITVAKERLEAFIHGFGSFDHAVQVHMTSDYVTHIEIAYQPTAEVNFYFIPCTIGNNWPTRADAPTVGDARHL